MNVTKPRSNEISCNQKHIITILLDIIDVFSDVGAIFFFLVCSGLCLVMSLGLMAPKKRSVDMMSFLMPMLMDNSLQVGYNTRCLWTEPENLFSFLFSLSLQYVISKTSIKLTHLLCLLVQIWVCQQKSCIEMPYFHSWKFRMVCTHKSIVGCFSSFTSSKTFPTVCRVTPPHTVSKNVLLLYLSPY